MHGPVEIHIRITKIQQLFNSFDPSPFHEKDLDQDAEDYIDDSVDEHPLATPMKLVVELPAEECSAPDALGLEKAIHNYFAYRSDEARRRLRFHFRQGRIALALGVLFLVACMVARQVITTFLVGPIGPIIAEGVLILGWVSMWGPLQILLFDWWPMRHRVRLNSKLSTLPIEVTPVGDPGRRAG